MADKQTLRVGVIGMGWMGDVHARSYKAAIHRYLDLNVNIELIACADANEDLAKSAKDLHGFDQIETDWQQVVNNKDIDLVSVTTPNFLHEEICVAAANAKKHIWCEKPVGRSASETNNIAKVATENKIVSMSGFNYHWAPMVQYVKKMLANGELGEIEMFRGRFYSMYANDELGLFSWRFKKDLAGNGATGDLLSHVTDMALEIVGPISKVCGQKNTFISERPLPKPGKVSHYGRGEKGDPTAKVENEDFVGALVEFENGAMGVLEGWRSACGPKADMGFELYCKNGSVKWTFEDMNALQIFLKDKGSLDGYTRVLGGEVHPDHGVFNPGDGIPIGYEDTKTIECANFLRNIINNNLANSGLQRASDVADVGQAVLNSCESNKWENV